MKKNNDITLNRAWNHIDTIMASGMFQIVADDGNMVAVTGLEARRMGFSTDCFTGFDGRGIYGTAFLSMEQQPSYVKWRIEELIKFRAIIISTSFPVGRLLVNEDSDLVKIPNEEEKELYWDARKRKPRGRNSRKNKLGLNGANSYTWSKSRNQGHITAPNNSGQWISKKEAERNQGVAVKAGKRMKSSGHHADKKRSLLSASAIKKTERKMNQVNAVDLKGLNKKLQAEQDKKAKEVDRLNNGETETGMDDDAFFDAFFAAAEKKE